VKFPKFGFQKNNFIVWQQFLSHSQVIFQHDRINTQQPLMLFFMPNLCISSSS